MKEMNQFELENVAGGNDLAYDIGHAIGDGARGAWNWVAGWFN